MGLYRGGGERLIDGGEGANNQIFTVCHMVLFKPSKLAGTDLFFLHIQVGSKAKNTFIYNSQRRIFIPSKFSSTLSSGAVT